MKGDHSCDFIFYISCFGLQLPNILFNLDCKSLSKNNNSTHIVWVTGIMFSDSRKSNVIVFQQVNQVPINFQVIYSCLQILYVLSYQTSLSWQQPQMSNGDYKEL